MDVVLRSHGTSLSAYDAKVITGRLLAATDRVRRYLRRVSVRLEDENGEKGGNDKRCVIVAELTDSTSVVVRDRRETVLAAATRAAHRMGLAIRARIGRRETVRLRPRSPISTAIESE